MALKICAVVCIIVLISTADFVRSLRSCSCLNRVWDCSFLGKSMLLPEEKKCYSWYWRLQHNNLRRIPEPYHKPSEIQEIDISYNMLGLGEATPVVFPNLYYLDVSGNYLKTLDFLFSSKTNVLVANDNEISDISVYRLMSVTQQLILARNKIISLPPNSFGETLIYVDLSGNPLTSISEQAFSGLNELEILHLNGTRQLSTLAKGTFNDLTSLKHLSLNDNKLVNLPEGLFATSENLEALYLHLNELEKLPLGIFQNLYNLRYLNLDNNQLTDLPEGLFSRMHSLEDLSVRSNRLKALPVLRLCSGPISTVTFDDNDIDSVDEPAVRALLRNGFLFGDVHGNPVDENSLQWVDDASDLVLHHNTFDCRTIYMQKTDNHGSVSFCVSTFSEETDEIVTPRVVKSEESKEINEFSSKVELGNIQ